MGALTASIADIGIDEEFIKQVRQTVTPGTSALFLYTQKGPGGATGQTQYGPNRPLLIIQSSLSAEQEAKLRAAFGEDSVPVLRGLARFYRRRQADNTTRMCRGKRQTPLLRSREQRAT
jgi:uncharacterized membrane protein